MSAKNPHLRQTLTQTLIEVSTAIRTHRNFDRALTILNRFVGANLDFPPALPASGYVVAVGSLSTGFALHGPFPTHASANAYRQWLAVDDATVVRIIWPATELDEEKEDV